MSMIHRITCKKCGAEIEAFTEFEVHIRYEEHMKARHPRRKM